MRKLLFLAKFSQTKFGFCVQNDMCFSLERDNIMQNVQSLGIRDIEVTTVTTARVNINVQQEKLPSWAVVPETKTQIIALKFAHKQEIISESIINLVGMEFRTSTS